MKTKSSLTWLASAILTCASATAQFGGPPPPPGTPPPNGPLPPPPPGERGERGPRPPGPDARGGERGPRVRDAQADRHDGRDNQDRHEARDGQDRHDGRDGKDGREARDGQDRHEGRDGKDGREARDGHDGRGEREEGGRGEGRPEMRGHDGEHGGAPRPEPKREPQPYLGVMAAPVPPPLAAQLGLAEGFGLLVVDVLPGSPAATAGLQKFDVLKLLGDQQLVDPQQLSTLVRAAGKDKEVALTVIRKAQEQKVTAKIGEHAAPPHMPFPEGGMFHGPGSLRDHIREFHEHLRGGPPEGGHPPQGEEPRHRQGGAPEPGSPTAQVQPEDLLREAQPEGGAQIKLLTEAGLTTMEGSKSRLLLKDGDGEIVIAAENGARTLTARDPQGAVTFTGPVDTKEQREAVPAALRSKLEAIHLRPLVEKGETAVATAPADPEVQ